MATFTLPVPWRGDNECGLSGVVEVNNSDFVKEGVVEARVRDLIAILNKKLERTPSARNGLPEVTSVMLHGVKVSRNSLVAYLVPELMCSSPRLVATTQLRKRRTMTVLVKTLSGKPVRICCKLTDTVAYIKARVEEQEGIPCEDQRLVYGGKQLRDHVRLSTYDIGNEATLHLSLRLLGGISGGLAPSRTFADVSDGSILTAIEFSPDAPEWFRCSKGLNIEGRCTNRECRAFRQMVIDRKRFDWFNVIQDDDVKCPICQCKVKPVTCGLDDCTWRYEGVKTNDGVSICSPWMDAKGYVYHRFNADENNGSVEWSSLMLVAKPVIANLVLAQPVQVSKYDLCSVCYSPFGSPVKGDTTTTRCGHTFHRVCSRMWATYCKKRNTQPSCAICRRST